MIRVIFKNLKKSDLIRTVAMDRVEKTLHKFPELENLTSTVIVSREHSPEHAGVDLFAVKLLVEGKGTRPIILEKRAESLYQAIALLTDRALEILHRAIEKERDILRDERRKWKSYQRYSVPASGLGHAS